MEASDTQDCIKEKDNEYTEEEILIYVNFDDMTEECPDEDLRNFKILGLDTKEPIMQIGNKVFGGSWKDTMGTAVFFEESEKKPKKCFFSVDVPKPLEYLTKTNKALTMNRVFITSKENSSSEATTSKTENDV